MLVQVCRAGTDDILDVGNFGVVLYTETTETDDMIKRVVVFMLA